jgi:uncharacterized phosphosugar-binding protein
MSEIKAGLYFDYLIELMEKIKATQLENISKAAEILATAVSEDKRIHLFGTGHSTLAAFEPFSRSGNLGNLNMMCEVPASVFSAWRSHFFEMLEGYANEILEFHSVEAGEPIVIVSNTGRHTVPVEMAMGARERGLTVIAITSKGLSEQLEPTHTSGKKLYELADVVLDNQSERGDGSVEIPELGRKIGTHSSIASTAIMVSLLVETVDKVLEKGIKPPLYLYVDEPNFEEHNDKILKRYRKRVKAL